jgi:hypothetical protein
VNLLTHEVDHLLHLLICLAPFADMYLVDILIGELLPEAFWHPCIYMASMLEHINTDCFKHTVPGFEREISLLCFLEDFSK